MIDKKEFALKVIDLALKKGADQAEIYLRDSRDLTIEVKNQEIDAIESSISIGYSLRVISDRRLGFSYSTSEDEAEKVADNAVNAARWSDQDEYLDLPAKDSALDVDQSLLGIYDEEISNLKNDEAIKYAIAVEKGARDFDSRIKKIRKASCAFTSGEIMIFNSKGISASYPYTKCFAHVMTVAEEGSESQMGWDFDGRRFLRDLSFESVGRNAAQRAVQLLGARKISTIKAPVILDNSVTAEFLGIFATSLSAESVQKGRSLLMGKTGKKVICPEINLIDDGLIPRGLGTRPFDDEGVLPTKKMLINKGVLEGYLHNTYTAKKAGLSSTGNAVRGGYAGLPSVGISNLYLDAASSSFVMPFKDLIGSVDKGLYITEAMGVHTANPISGEFSIGVSGLWIENGEIKFPVKESVLSGNVLNLFQKIEAAGDDMRFYDKIGTPSLLIGAVDISA